MKDLRDFATKKTHQQFLDVFFDYEAIDILRDELAEFRDAKNITIYRLSNILQISRMTIKKFLDVKKAQKFHPKIIKKVTEFLDIQNN